MIHLGVTFIKELIDNYRLETYWSYQVSAFIILNRRMLFTFVTRAYGWLLSFLELFNASIEDNTPFGEGIIVRVYSNRVACARVSRRITGQCTECVLYTRASRRVNTHSKSLPVWVVYAHES